MLIGRGFQSGDWFGYPRATNSAPHTTKHPPLPAPDVLPNAPQYFLLQLSLLLGPTLHLTGLLPDIAPRCLFA